MNIYLTSNNNRAKPSLPTPEGHERQHEIPHDDSCETRHAQQAFRDNGFDIGRTQSPIIPLFVRDTIKAMKIVRKAYEDGIFITPVIAPAVPENDVLIRFALMATHSTAQVDEAVEKLTGIFREVGVIA